MKDSKTVPKELTAQQWEEEAASLGKALQKADLDSRNFTYNTLSRVYSLSCVVHERVDIQTRLKALAEKPDLSFDKPILVHAHVLRYAVGKLTRQRISDFAAVLTEANLADVRPEAFISWVRKKGTKAILKNRRDRLKKEKETETKKEQDQPSNGEQSSKTTQLKFPRPPGLELEHGTYAAIIVIDSQNVEFKRQSRHIDAVRATMKALNEEAAKAEERASRVSGAKARRQRSDNTNTGVPA